MQRHNTNTKHTSTTSNTLFSNKKKLIRADELENNYKIYLPLDEGSHTNGMKANSETVETSSPVFTSVQIKIHGAFNSNKTLC